MKKRTIEELGRMTAEQFHQAQKLPLVAVLDNVRSQHNIGAVFRTADAFRLHSVVLCGICCCPPNTEIHKTALGAEETVDWQYYADTMEAVRKLKENGYTVYAVEQVHQSKTLEEVALEWREAHEHNTSEASGIAVVFGHEVFGVQQAVVDQCDGCIEIPQYGTKHSLNVSVTAGIVLYTLAQTFSQDAVS